MRKNYTSIFGLLKSNLGSLSLFLSCIAGALPSTMDAQAVTYTFVTAGATGTTGPTQAQLNTAYASTNLNGLVTSANGVQSFTIVQGGPYRFISIGAQGGYGGGHGAYISGDYTLTAGTVVKIVVGQAGQQASNGSAYTSGGGGGGSYVSNPSNAPYVIAGGGGGNGDGYQGYPASGGMDASLTQSALPYPGGSTGASGGNGGSCGSASGVASAGGGLNTDGSFCGVVTRAVALAFVNGSTGGQGGSYSTFDPYGGDGGFGGGGGGFNSGTGQRGGGGGGYSGGQGGVAFNTPSNDAAGSGGASFLGGANQTASVTTKTGDGIVMIQQLCDVNITASTSNSLHPSICSGQTVTLTTNAASNYSWSTGSTSTSIVVSPSSTTSYTVGGMSSIGCSNSAVITITVNSSVPSLTVTSNTPSVCLGNTLTITGSGALTYTWTGGITNGVPFTPPNGVTTYSVVGANGCGTTSATKAVTVTPLPVTGVTTSSLVCSGSPATLTPGGAANYTWMPGSNTSTSYIVAPTANTIYTLTGQTGNCSNSVTVVIHTNPLPVLTIAASNSVLCAGDNVNLTVSGNALTYTWNPGGQTGTNISATPANSTAFTVSGRDGNNCLGTATKVIVVYPLPFITAVSSAGDVCSGSPVTLTAFGGATYTWVTTPASNTNSVVINPTASGTIVVNAKSTQGCIGSTSIYVGVFEPSITVSSNTAICLGASTTLFADGADSYFWDNNSSPTQAISVSPTSNTTYTVTGMVNNQAGLLCPATETIDVTVNPLPVITASSDSPTICVGKSASLTATGAGATGTYTWAGGLGTTAMITVSPFATITYTINGTDANGCKNVGTVLQSVSPCTGINALTANAVNLVIYPNPSNGEFTISSDENITLNIVNELGQQVKVISLNATTHDVKVNNLTNGVYFITGVNENGSVKQKIVVSK